MNILFIKYGVAIVALLLLSTIFIGCENPVAAVVRLNEEFQLRVGEEASVNGENLYMKFISVPEDSRCPLEFECFWSGNAEVVFSIRKDSNRAIKDSLNTHIDPRGLEYLDYKINLIKLEPYPQRDESIPQTSYIATFIIENECDK
jgi:hypothetical protein